MTSGTVSDGAAVLLDEERLRTLSRSTRSLIPSSTSTGQSTIDELEVLERLFDNVFFTCNSSGLTAGHRVAAWNTLCSLIDQTVDCPSENVKKTIWTNGVWARAFALYLSHAQTARPKSSRQLLVTLTNGLRKADESDIAQYKQSALEQLLSGLKDFQDPYRAKASAQLLSHLLNKHVISLKDILGSQTGGSIDLPVEDSKLLESQVQEILEVSFRWLGKADFGSSVAQLVSTLLDKHDEMRLTMHSLENQVASRPVWVGPLEATSKSDEVNSDDLRVHVLPVLFKRSFDNFVAFLYTQNVSSLNLSQSSNEQVDSYRDTLLFAALQTGKDLGMVVETDEQGIHSDGKCFFIPVSSIGRLLLRRSRSARLTGLNMLVTSHAATRPFSPVGLKWIRRGLELCSADVDADFRSELFSVFQRMLDRMRAITSVLARNTALPHKIASRQQQALPDQASKVLLYHQNFLKWLPRFLAQQLQPTANYQRHISGLKCLSILARSGLDVSVPAENWSRTALQEVKWPFNLGVLSQDIHQLLLDLVLDPFDDVRQTAASILSLCCSALHERSSFSPKFFTHALERAETAMLNTGRADQADGVAHIYALIHGSCSAAESDPEDFWSSKQAIVRHLTKKVQLMLESARESLAKAVGHYPIHGLLTSLRYVLGQNPEIDVILRARLIEQVNEVWLVVKPVLCNDAPEGYTPDELEESPDSTKETLSYCWRALKEASLLLSTLLAGYRMSNALERNDATLEKMGDQCFTQLAELRHRGAFSTVAQTWTACCLRCQSLRTIDGTLLLESWYLRVLVMLRKNVTINTRRSAGLPALLCGILIADKSAKLLAQAFQDLEAIARQEVDATDAEEGNLAQVHAMNCLKDVFKNTRLGQQSERYIPVGLQLAADALRSEVWAIRNCGLMLFRALIDRLLGTDSSHFEDGAAGQKYISAEQHPELLNVILSLLSQPNSSPGAASARYEGVFPALQLIQHTKIPGSRLEEARLAVRSLTACPSWHVRDKAARALASMMTEDDVEVTFQHVKLLVDHAGSQNALHGALLTTCYILHKLKRGSKHDVAAMIGHDTEIPVQTRLELMRWSWRVLPLCGNCTVTKAACVDLATECFGFLTDLGSPETYLAEVEAEVLSQSSNVTNLYSRPSTRYRDLLASCLHDPKAAVLRQACARSMAKMLPFDRLEDEEDVAAFSKSIYELGQIDQNAVVYFFQALNLAGLSTSTRLLVQQLATNILDAKLGFELMCEAQSVLIKLSEAESDQSISRKPQRTQDHLAWANCNQRFADGVLKLQAVQLDRIASKTRDLSEEHLEEITSWANACVLAINDTGIHTREAAAEALDRTRYLWSVVTTHRRLDATFHRLCVSIYDLLNDDDEDIRLLAARITCRILTAATQEQQVEYEPIVSSQKLLSFCISRWTDKDFLAATAFQRAFDCSGGVAPRAVGEAIAALARSDTALFATEKQNLYIDDAREVRIWSQVIQKMRLTSPHFTKVVYALASWFDEGLGALKKQAEDVLDGALGWSSKAEIFTLGLQVIYGAEVLLSLVKQGARIPIQPTDLRRKMFECLLAFEAAGVNPLWRWEMERILTDSVTHKVKTLSELAEALSVQTSV
ncbi:HEAT repeat [Lecanosticta acicola]|uniref:HEAT repeat n=1 Tax=Lecanosticta acicola TaxID=111012 RepID=A0AAI8YZ26_9PEZI|nr:HEAT repeat [Lecanosticta acicola]